MAPGVDKPGNCAIKGNPVAEGVNPDRRLDSLGVKPVFFNEFKNRL